MRTKQEITLAIDLLDKYGGEWKHVQKSVICNRQSESEVFDNFVVRMAEEKKNEALFFAARDAAQYMAGKLPIQELMPNLPDGVLEGLTQQQSETEETITLTRKEFNNLVRRIERLERRIGLQYHSLDKVERKDVSEAPSDIISQAEACRLLGCGKSTIRRWADKGLVIGYMKGKRVCYSRRGLLHSDVVKEYKAEKEENHE